MFRIKLLCNAACPEWNGGVGDIVSVPESTARDFVSIGAAVAVDTLPEVVPAQAPAEESQVEETATEGGGKPARKRRG